MALGKGLSALISEDTIGDINRAYIPNLEVDLIKPNPYQPRVAIKGEDLVELADSIRENGIIEPLIVTRENKTGEYQLIAGERRLRAAKLAKVKTVPVVIKEASPQQMLEMAVIENLQRQDLNPLEEALAFKQLQDMFDMSIDNISKKIGYSRPAIANKIRLLSLPDEVKKHLLEDNLSEGHARALLGLRSDKAMEFGADLIVKDQLSVRATEEMVRRLNRGEPKKKTGISRVVDKETIQMENNLKDKFGKGVKLFRSKKGGKIVIPFKSDSELEQFYSIILN